LISEASRGGNLRKYTFSVI